MRNIFVLSLIFVLSACGDDSFKVQPIQVTDKDLSCKDIDLEINESQFHKEQAQEKKSLGINEIVMPLGYIDTYMSADEAIEAANSRIEYLERVYEVKGCGQIDVGRGNESAE